MNKTARELKAGEITAIMGSRDGNWFVKNWTVETVTDYTELGYTEVQLKLHSASEQFLRIDSSEDLTLTINHKDEAFELFAICTGQVA